MPHTGQRPRSPVVRLRMPDEDLAWDDLVRSETTIKAGTVPDFALTRGSVTRSRW